MHFHIHSYCTPKRRVWMLNMWQYEFVGIYSIIYKRNMGILDACSDGVYLAIFFSPSKRPGDEASLQYILLFSAIAASCIIVSSGVCDRNRSLLHGRSSLLGRSGLGPTTFWSPSPTTTMQSSTIAQGHFSDLHPCACA